MQKIDFTLWGNTSQRWGHKLHSMCSYLGTFPPSLARYFISMLSENGDIVFDPFCGRGTVHLESRLSGRYPISSDLNPIAITLTKAKSLNIKSEDLQTRILELENKYQEFIYLNEAAVQNENIKLIFDQRTLAQLCYLKKKLKKNDNSTDVFLLGVLLGILHGKERKDGSSAYASISMPNTFSMSPTYVRKFVATKQLNRTYRNVFELLRKKINLLTPELLSNLDSGVVAECDARKLTEHKLLNQYLGKVKLILTSPPYLDIVNYAKQNWIRTWLLDYDSDSVSEGLDDNLTLDNWKRFMNVSLTEMEQFISQDGIIVLVIGDVVKSSRSAISLAREFIREILHEERFKFVGLINDKIKSGEKTTRIWSETKGKATETDRIVLLSHTKPQFKRKELIKIFDLSEEDFTDLNANDLEENARVLAGIN